MSTQTCNQTAHNGCCGTEQDTNNVLVFEPRVDIAESEGELTVYADIPGVPPESLNVEFEDGELKITGTVPPRTSDKPVLRSEYKIGDFSRAFKIGDTLDAEKIRAELKNGVLTVHLPKVEKLKPRRVEITTTG